MRSCGTRDIGLCGAAVLAVVGLGSSSAFAAGVQTAIAADAPVAEAAPAGTGPVYGYVGRSDKAKFHQLTIANVALTSHFGYTGLLLDVAGSTAAAAIQQQGLAPDEYDPVIADPSEDLARAIAGGLADAKGGSLANGPIARDLWRAHGQKDAARAMGARYVVEVAPVTMTLSYFALDWTHYDLMLNTTARIIDTADGRVISKAGCSIQHDHSGPLAGRRELLTNHAEKLRAVAAVKTSACLAKLQAGVDLPAATGQLMAVAAPVPVPAMPSAPAPRAAESVVVVSDASTTCDADKERYAAELGVACSALGQKVELPQTAVSTIE